jgi:hypothetical protein
MQKQLILQDSLDIVPKLLQTFRTGIQHVIVPKNHRKFRMGRNSKSVD